MSMKLSVCQLYKSPKSKIESECIYFGVLNFKSSIRLTRRQPAWQFPEEDGAHIANAQAGLVFHGLLVSAP